MKLHEHPDAGAFLAAAREHLAANEALHGMPIAVAVRAKETGVPGYFVTAHDGAGALAGFACMVLPRAQCVGGTPEAARLVAEDLAARGVAVPAVTGPEPAVEAFAEQYARRTGRRARQPVKLGAYELTTLREPAYAEGSLRPAAREDEPLLVAWFLGFIRDTGVPWSGDVTDSTRRLTEAGGLFVWERRGAAVSMAARTGATFTGARVSFVYTPTELRGRGYARSCVAALSKQMLASGLARCLLLADDGNPVSTGIYVKMGYERRGTTMEIGFDG